jgi:DNA polymerase
MLAHYCEGLDMLPGLLDFFADPQYAATRFPAQSLDSLLLNSYKPPCPQWWIDAVARGDMFVAHNARFEQAVTFWILVRQWGWPMPARWSCTAARARYWGIRASLEGAASDLELNFQKNDAGKQFINDFCKPRKYKGAKKLGIIKDMWYEPHEQPELYAGGKAYCVDDVLAEVGIDRMLPDLPEFEQRVFDLDFRLNTRGMPVDIQAVKRAMEFADHYTEQNTARFNEITGVNPTQRDRILDYIKQREEIADLGDLRSKTLKRVVQADLPADLQDVINIRLETSKASIKKLETMVRCTDSDGFARGGHLFYGAHTGRWSHKRIQTGNMTRPDMAVLKGMFEYLEGPWWGNPGMVGHNGGPPLDDMPQQPEWVFEAGMRFPRPLGALAKSMRGFIAAPKGKRIVSGDYAQIEARVLVWLARCMWVLEAFGNGDDVYTRFACQYMYPNEMGAYEDCIVLKNGKPKVLEIWTPHRQKAKSAQLGCGFQVSGRGFMEYCDNIDLIIPLTEAEEIVKKYRKAHPEIANYESGLWARVERAAILATTHEGQSFGLTGTNVTFHIHRLDVERYWLICTLPSGRHIAYYRPKVRLGERFGRTVEKLSFRTEWNGKSYREDTYGGKLVENIVQGTARDVCAVGALNVDEAGYPVVGLVHDEVITLPDDGFGSSDDLVRLMVTLPGWITDLPVEAEGAEMLRYGK